MQRNHRHRYSLPLLLVVVAVVGLLGYKAFSVADSMLSDARHAFDDKREMPLSAPAYSHLPSKMPNLSMRFFSTAPKTTSAVPSLAQPEFNALDATFGGSVTLRQSSSAVAQSYGGSSYHVAPLATFSVNRTSSDMAVASSSVITPNMHTTIHTAASSIEPVAADHPSSPEAAMRHLPTLPKDPFLEPLGAVPFAFMSLLVAGYLALVFLRRKRADL